MRLLIALVVWIAAAAGAAELSIAVESAVKKHPSGASASTATPGSSGQSGGGSVAVPSDPSSVKSTDAVSLLHTANFSRALAAARAHLGPGAHFSDLALYPGYMALTAVTAAGETNVTIDANGTYMQLSTGGSAAGSAVFPLARVRPDVPAALARRIATSGRVPVSQLNYMVVQGDPTSPGLRWLVYPKQGNRVEYFEAPGAGGQLQELLAGSGSGLQPVHG
jgi:hypothetical protein